MPSHPIDLATLIQQLHAALPQTQCTRCGYPDCLAYAQAIAHGQTGINQCPPGGAQGIAQLAEISGQAITPLNPNNGQEAPRQLAVIDEAWCIGCTLCLPVCPTDAIVGTHKKMHTVIDAHCTGCELCIPVCPVDCIALVPVSGERTGWAAWSAAQAQSALKRYEFHSERRQREQQNQHLQAHVGDPLATPLAPAHKPQDEELNRKRSVIEAALERAKQKRIGSQP